MASTVTELLRRRFGGKKEAVLLVDAMMNFFIRFLDGTVPPNNDFFYTTPINVNAGDEVVFSCYGGGSTAVIAKFNGVSEYYTGLVKGSGSTTYKTYTYTMTEDCQIAFSAKIGVNDAVATINGKNVTINYPQ